MPKVLQQREPQNKPNTDLGHMGHGGQRIFEYSLPMIKNMHTMYTMYTNFTPTIECHKHEGNIKCHMDNLSQILMKHSESDHEFINICVIRRQGKLTGI